MTKLEIFTSAYIDAIYFTETGDIDQPGSSDELTLLSKAAIYRQCRDFYEAYRDLIGGNIAQAGHDFWLTRNRHGTGFWDREKVYGKALADVLTRASHACGEFEAEFM